MKILFFISYFMIFVLFIVLLRFNVSRGHFGWALLGACVCYGVLSPYVFPLFPPLPQVIRLLFNVSVLFIGLMVPSIPTILISSLGVIGFLVWFIIYSFWNNIMSEIMLFVFVAVIGLLMIVAVVQLKNAMQTFRRIFYEAFGPSSTTGERDYSGYDSYVEEEMIRLPVRRVEVV